MLQFLPSGRSSGRRLFPNRLYFAFILTALWSSCIITHYRRLSHASPCHLYSIIELFCGLPHTSTQLFHLRYLNPRFRRLTPWVNVIYQQKSQSATCLIAQGGLPYVRACKITVCCDNTGSVDERIGTEQRHKFTQSKKCFFKLADHHHDQLVWVKLVKCL